VDDAQSDALAPLHHLVHARVDQLDGLGFATLPGDERQRRIGPKLASHGGAGRLHLLDHRRGQVDLARVDEDPHA
jgi:hypothetical protein